MEELRKSADEKKRAGMERAARDIKKHIEEAPTDEKSIQEFLDSSIKDESDRKRKCSEFISTKNGKRGYTLDTVNKRLNEKISGDRKLSRRHSDVWENYHDLVRTLENNFLMSKHIGSNSLVSKDLIDQAILNYDSGWTKIYSSLKDNRLFTSSYKSTLEQTKKNHQIIISILQNQKNSDAAIKNIRPYLSIIKQNLTSFPDFTLADAKRNNKKPALIFEKQLKGDWIKTLNPKQIENLSRFQANFAKQVNSAQPQINAMLAKRRQDVNEHVKKILGSASTQNQLNESYKQYKEKIENPILSIFTEELDCE